MAAIVIVFLYSDFKSRKVSWIRPGILTTSLGFRLFKGLSPPSTNDNYGDITLWAFTLKDDTLLWFCKWWGQGLILAGKPSEEPCNRVFVTATCYAKPPHKKQEGINEWEFYLCFLMCDTDGFWLAVSVFFYCSCHVVLIAVCISSSNWVITAFKMIHLNLLWECLVWKVLKAHILGHGERVLHYKWRLTNKKNNYDGWDSYVIKACRISFFVVPPLKFQAPPSCQPLIGSTFDLKISVEPMTSQSIAAHNHRALNILIVRLSEYLMR